MKSIQFYLSGKERSLLLEALTCYIDMHTEVGGEMSTNIQNQLDEGIGKIMYKLYKGCIGQKYYVEYVNKKERTNDSRS